MLKINAAEHCFVGTDGHEVVLQSRLLPFKLFAAVILIVMLKTIAPIGLQLVAVTFHSAGQECVSKVEKGSM